MMRVPLVPQTRQEPYEEYADHKIPTNGLGLRIFRAPSRARTFSFEVLGAARGIWLTEATAERLLHSLARHLGYAVRKIR